MQAVNDSTGVCVLSNGRVTLRGHCVEDVPWIVQQCTDPSSQQYTSVPRPYGVADAEVFVRECVAAWQDPDGARQWVVEYLDDAGQCHFGGTLGLRPLSMGIAEIRFGLHPEARGKRVMSEAVRLACAWWFEQGGTRVHWYAIRGNVPSWRVAWACGFTYMGNIPGFRVDGNGVPREHWSATLGKGEPLDPKTAWFEAPTHIGDTPLCEGPAKLRPWRDTDADQVGLVTAPTHHVPAGSLITPESFHTWLLTATERMIFGRAKHWCIADPVTDAPLGDILLNMSQPGSAELGFQVFTHAVGRGVASAAARLVLQVAFTSVADGGLGLRSVSARCSTDNFASARALAKAGLMPYGTESATDVLADGSTQGLIHWQVLSPSSQSTDAVSVLPLPPNQWQRLRALSLRALVENPEIFLQSFDEAVKKPVEQWVSAAQAAGRFVAVVSGFDAGMVKVAAQESKWFVSGLWSDPACRGLGVGRKLLAACVSFVRQQGADQLFLVVEQGNSVAISLYERCGFVPTGRTRRRGDQVGVEYVLGVG